MGGPATPGRREASKPSRSPYPVISINIYCLLRLGVLIDATYGLQFLLDLHVKGPSLHGDDLGGRIGIMRDGRTAFRAEDTVDGLTGASLASPALSWAVDSYFSLGDYGDES
jgi:hypothetical protein